MRSSLKSFAQPDRFWSAAALCRFLWLAALVGLTMQTHAQRVVEGKSLKFPEYYEAPHQNQLKSLLEGARVQPRTNDIFFVTQAKLQTYREDGTPEMIVTAPQCFLDRSNRVVYSAGPMHAQTADGGFSIEGEGFLCQQTNSNLTISNKAHTILFPDLLESKEKKEPAKPANEGPGEIEIFSDHFNYDGVSGQGVYLDNVRAIGTNLAMQSAILTVLLPMKEGRKPSELKTIVAETNVVLDYVLANQETVHSTGDRATYTTDTSLARITGHPTWREQEREGRAEELIIDRAEKTFLANGQAWFKTPARTNGMSGILPEAALAKTNAPGTGTNEFVEIYSDNYEFRTNIAFFRQDVHVSEKAGDQLKGKMDCRLLTLTFTGTNELQRMIAEDKVVIEQGEQMEQGFSAGKAVYEGKTGIMELTQNPSWRSGLREGKGDVLLVNVNQSQMDVRGNASMRLPAQEIGQTIPGGLAATNTVSDKPAATQFADLFSDNYQLSAQEGHFNGKVRVEHPRMKWNCEKMTAYFPKPGEKDQKLVAEQAVVFDLSESDTQPDRTVHGTGEKVVYTYNITPTGTNDLIEMTGNPVLKTAQNTVENKIILFDRARNTLITPGKYRIHGTTLATAVNFTPSLKK